MRNGTRLLVVWNVVVTVALVAGVAGPWAPASAQLSAYSAQVPRHDPGDGSSATADDLIESTAPDALVAVTATGLARRHSHLCLVTASAEATFAGDGVFVFYIDHDQSPIPASERRIEMFNNKGIADDSFEEVSTTIAVTIPPAPTDPTFTFYARKSSSADGNVLVSASSITMVCLAKDV
jgi:hypothetical protein